MPVRNSTSGYIGEIGTLQPRHFPRSRSQLTTGMLSYALISLPHFGHAEAGMTIDLPPGMRRMQTFRKLPMMSPKTNAKPAMMGVGSGTALFCAYGAGGSSCASGAVARLLTRNASEMSKS